MTPLAEHEFPVRKVARVIIVVLTIVAGVASYAASTIGDAPAWVATIAGGATWLVGALTIKFGSVQVQKVVTPAPHVEALLTGLLDQIGTSKSSTTDVTLPPADVPAAADPVALADADIEAAATEAGLA